MPRLIHLNGPSGIGKSTIAQLYADRHPGVLNLDIDQVVSLIGGWEDDFWNALKAGAALAVAMAETHLRSGHDVVMPQLATKLAEVEGFEAAASRTGSEYREIVLWSGKQQALDRFAARAASGDPARHRRIDDIVKEKGGPVLLERIHDHVTEFLRHRPECVVVDTEEHDAEQTYDALLTVLGQ
ncbi:AAA family ATPase [Amycolatopsis sp. NPDC059027]|uniref:AAA family ATPase n=1 Tax=Amycolatopsis sp. NPDC059027 TaxID=3346709 RepID=UPI00366F187A